MSHGHPITINGEVTDIFAHRFVVQTASGPVLADVGPKGAERLRLERGERVVLTGEMKPSELKVRTFAKEGAPPVAIGHDREDHARGDADPRTALRTAEANGFKVLGQPRRKPKHFELLGRDAAGDLVELHVELDGALRKTRPVEDADPKWRAEIRGGD